MPIFTQEIDASVVSSVEVEVKNDAGSPVPISGTVTATATNLDIRDLVFATDKVDASGTTLGANSGVDVGDVTVNNAAGASAVNIQDGGNSITIDGTVSVSGTVSTTVGGTGTATVTSVSVSPTVATLSASNAAKTKVIVHNETGILYVKLGSGASSTSYSYRLTGNTVVEIEGYYGIVTGTKGTGTTNALVTEVGI